MTIKMADERTTKKRSRGEMIAAIAALEERRRREIDSRASYVPNEGQLTIHRSQKRERFVFSGNGAGKTTLLIQELLWTATGFNPVLKKNTKVPAKCVLVLDSPDKVAQKVVPEIKKWYPLKEDQLHKDGKPYHSRITFPNGSEIVIMFHDQDPMKFESIDDIDFNGFDEPPPKHIYIALLRGTRGKRSLPKTLLVGTPLAAPWLRTDIFEPWSRGEEPDVECFKFSTHVNADNLRTGFIEDFSRRLSEQELRIRIHGDFFDLSGLALTHLIDRSVHFIKPFDWPRDWPLILVVDPHPRKAHVAILLGASTDDQLFVIKETSSKTAPSEFARELATFCDGYQIVDAVCDSLGSSDLTGGMGRLSFIQVLNRTWQEEGTQLRIRPTTYNEKLDEAWIQRIQEALLIPDEPDQLGNRIPELRVFDTCKGTIFDIENAAWYKVRLSEEVKPKIDMTKRDFLSCLKYGLAAQPRGNMTKQRILRSSPSPWSGAAGAHKNRLKYSKTTARYLTDDDDW
jgi:hypothetical protein